MDGYIEIEGLKLRKDLCKSVSLDDFEKTYGVHIKGNVSEAWQKLGGVKKKEVKKKTDVRETK